ncbi:MAG: T9SS type A sorting domain-containing protein [Saprospiraceae bacterium]|nr:T9SS type A sorting domain-containing protein [Saprospiraceae bacterium]
MESNKYSIIYLNDVYPKQHTLQSIGDSLPPGWDHSVFSPDGKWYARYSWWGWSGAGCSSLYLYNFDRCSGELSNFRSYRLKDDGPGGVAISPNSRYLYVSNWDTIFQYDLYAQDIFATETVVAGYDGFRGEDGWPVRFFTPQLAPDGRIYICVPNVSSRYLHYIEHPDSAGLACKVVQHGIKLPVYNSNTLPNLPYFRLYEEKGSPCDTIWKGEREDYAGILLHPNPGGASVNLRIPGDGLEREGQLNMYSTIGSLVLNMPLPAKTTDNSINTNALGIGLYFYEVVVNGKRVSRGKWIKNQN